MLPGHCVYYLLLLSVIYNNLSDARPSSVTGFLSTTATTNTKAEITGNKTKTRILNRGEYINEYAEQDIIFPDSSRVVFEPLPKLDGPPKCAENGQIFCENDPLYPSNQIDNLLKHHQIQSDLFGEDEPPDHHHISSINNRIGEDGTDENYLCSSQIRTIYPKTGLNKDDEWKYIINQPEGYIQGVRIETCRRENAPCDTIVQVPNGYITSCKQKYMYRRMMSLTNSGEPVADSFRLPSACCCSYRKNFGFLSRFGRPLTPAK